MKDKTFTQEEINSRCKKGNISEFERYDPEWINLNTIQSKTQPWFWPGIIPLETLTLFAGYGGIGKSLLLNFIAAKTTTGESFNAGGLTHQFPQGDVILLSAEEDLQTQLKPKLIAANFDNSRIHFLKSKVGSVSKKKKFIELDRDIYILENKIEELGSDKVKLLIIDPIAYFIGETKDHYNPDVANFLQLLIDLSKTYHIATIINKHLRKQASGSKGASIAADEVGGAGAWTNTPRKNWLISDHHDDINIKVITQIKDNLNKKEKEALAFKIVPIIIDDNGEKVDTTHLVWLDKLQNITSEEAVSEEKYQKSKMNNAIDFIYNYLVKNGQSVVAHIYQEANKTGITKTTFRRAQEEFEQAHKKQLKITKGIKGSKIYQLFEEF